MYFIASFLRNMDFFGHPVTMHFGRSLSKKKEGDAEQKTMLGGFHSILIRSIFFYTVVIYCRKMINADENSIDISKNFVEWHLLAKN